MRISRNSVSIPTSIAAGSVADSNATLPAASKFRSFRRNSCRSCFSSAATYSSKSPDRFDSRAHRLVRLRYRPSPISADAAMRRNHRPAARKPQNVAAVVRSSRNHSENPCRN
jgi:hypothetical protein